MAETVPSMGTSDPCAESMSGAVTSEDLGFISSTMVSDSQSETSGLLSEAKNETLPLGSVFTLRLVPSLHEEL